MSDTDLNDRILAAVRSPDNVCFACGPGNPHGLHIHVERDGDAACTLFVPTEWHAGWSGIVHGGILAALLDETMAYAVFFTGYKCVTARMEIRYRAPLQRGQEIRVEARVVGENRRIADVEGAVLRGDTLIAEASARFMKLGALDVESITTSFAANEAGPKGVR